MPNLFTNPNFPLAQTLQYGEFCAGGIMLAEVFPAISLRRVIEFINENLGEDISLSEIAEACRFEPVSFLAPRFSGNQPDWLRKATSWQKTHRTCQAITNRQRFIFSRSQPAKPDSKIRAISPQLFPQIYQIKPRKCGRRLKHAWGKWRGEGVMGLKGWIYQCYFFLNFNQFIFNFRLISYWFILIHPFTPITPSSFSHPFINSGGFEAIFKT